MIATAASTTTIRYANDADMARVIEMGCRFINSTPYRAHLTPSPAHMERLYQMLMLNDGGVLLAERDGQIVGMLGYMIYEHPMSGERGAVEFFWWVEPDARGDGMRLLRRAERDARDRGALRLQMIAPTDQVASVYQRLGYTFVESAYQKVL